MNQGSRTPAPSRAFPPNGSLVWGLTFSQIIGWGAMFHCFPVYLAPMQSELGWSSTELNLALTIGLVAADLAAIPAGAWLDRRGPRVMMTLGAIAGALLLALWSRVADLYAFYAIWALIGVANAMSLANLPAAVVTANVRDYRRGIAYVSFFSSLASTIAIPAASLLVTTLGWRNGLMIQAWLMLLGPALINAMVLRGARGSMMGTGTKSRPLEPSPVPQVIRTRAFWLLTVACSVHWFVAMSVSMHILPLMQERGLSLGAAVAIIALNGPSAVVGRLLTFYAVPGNSGLTTGKLVFPLFSLGALILALTGDGALWSFIAYAVVFGMASGVLMVVRQTSVAEIFGVRGYGSITGALATVAIVPRTVGPVAVAFMRDWYGSYDVVIWILFALTVAGTVAFYLAAGARRGD